MGSPRIFINNTTMRQCLYLMSERQMVPKLNFSINHFWPLTVRNGIERIKGQSGLNHFSFLISIANMTHFVLLSQTRTNAKMYYFCCSMYCASKRIFYHPQDSAACREVYMRRSFPKLLFSFFRVLENSFY